MFDIREELKRLPQKPGVYIMRDDKENIIYVGKAINLRNRVRQYFQSGNQHTPKTVSLVRHIRSFEYIVTDNEEEALILECNLIKTNKPKYNVLLKDDKAYPYIKVTVNEDFPRIFMSRSREKDKAKYLGPYTSALAVHEVIALASNIWPLRRCKKNIIKDTGQNNKPCLYHHIGECKAPCSGAITCEEYGKMVDEAVEFLSGKHQHILKDLEQKMLQASEDMEFEKAAEIRDKIIAVKRLDEKQSIDYSSQEDQDVIALARAHDEALVQVFFVRGGKTTGREHFMLNGADSLSRGEIITEFITQYYSGTPYIPKELIVEADIEDKAVITEWLSKKRGSKVVITAPQKGEKLKMVELAGKNALITFEQFGEQIKREKKRTRGAVLEIKEALGISRDIMRIEAYDISNIQGYESVASMVVFEEGKPKRNDYRKFKIKGVVGANDYASMEEVLSRRLSHYLKEKDELAASGRDLNEGKFTKLPDVIFIDGGKGQVSVVESVLEKMDISIPVCGMIKDDKHNTRGIIYNNNEIILSHSSEGFKLLTRIQDEVHRFAIEYHRKLRGINQVKSVLDDIEGIGSARRKALLRHFGSIAAIRAAEIEDLKNVPSMNIKSAEAVYNFFRK